MTRILLALLALLGFAAQAAPAEAGMRAVGSAQVGALQLGVAQHRTASVAMKSCAPPVMRQNPTSDACLPALRSQGGWRAPTVLPGIDRARE